RSSSPRRRKGGPCPRSRASSFFPSFQFVRSGGSILLSAPLSHLNERRGPLWDIWSKWPYSSGLESDSEQEGVAPAHAASGRVGHVVGIIPQCQAVGIRSFGEIHGEPERQRRMR